MREISFGLLVAWSLCVVVALIYVVLCPFTKVEESFNLQAIHDHIYLGSNISQFDHVVFTGPIPRTFIGSIIIGYIVKPLTLLLYAAPKVYMQYAARSTLTLLVLSAYLHFLAAVRRLFGISVAVWSCLILCTQFHFLFYASRPLPNSFAAVLTLLACSYWLRSKHREFVFFAGFAIIVFRCELAIMFGLMLLISLVYGNLNLMQLIKWISVTGVISLGATVLIDSFYWQRRVWPEGEAFHFNAILNKSSQWGTSPFLWYFYSALPRAMALSLLIAPLGMAIDKRCLVLSAPAFGFVLLYSILPHKELRFILYVVPVLNVAVARACSVIWHNRNKSMGRKLVAMMAAGHLLGNLVMTGVLLNVSYHNYPGGNALRFLNEHVPANQGVKVNIDIFSAQTGISRFLHEHQKWRYDKTEDESAVLADIHSYTHLLVGTPDESAIQAITAVYSQTHKPIHTEMCFKNIQITKQYPFLTVRLASCVWVFEKLEPQKESG